MPKTAAASSHTIDDRDFLVGSVWEGTGEEIHVNRHMADKSEFGGRILSGIGGMLLTIATFDRALVARQPTALEWAFNGHLLEGDRLTAFGEHVGHEYTIEGRVERDTGRRATTSGTLAYGQTGPELSLPDGLRTRGRTFTAADIDLFWNWLGTDEQPPSHEVPWPMVVLLASGLVSRSNHLGDHELTLNRGFTWTFQAAPAIGETLYCVVGPIRQRQSATRPDLKVGQYAVAIASYATDEVFATIEWTVLFR